MLTHNANLYEICLLFFSSSSNVEDLDVPKEEKKKKQSFLSKMGSYRQKRVSASCRSWSGTWVLCIECNGGWICLFLPCGMCACVLVQMGKDKPASASHQFVSISISNSTACDLCGKPMANKSCLQCESKILPSNSCVAFNLLLLVCVRGFYLLLNFKIDLICSLE